MLRSKTETRPGLVAFYDIWPGNGTGQFLQLWSPHRARPQRSLSSQSLGKYWQFNQQRPRDKVV